MDVLLSINWWLVWLLLAMMFLLLMAVDYRKGNPMLGPMTRWEAFLTAVMGMFVSPILFPAKAVVKLVKGTKWVLQAMQSPEKSA